jgi:hypothetical protein
MPAESPSAATPVKAADAAVKATQSVADAAAPVAAAPVAAAPVAAASVAAASVAAASVAAAPVAAASVAAAPVAAAPVASAPVARRAAPSDPTMDPSLAGLKARQFFARMIAATPAGLTIDFSDWQSASVERFFMAMTSPGLTRRREAPTSGIEQVSLTNAFQGFEWD